MVHTKETAAITSHLWKHHGRRRANGTRIERELFHEELHATAEPGELDHEHGPEGQFVVTCRCGHSHECGILAPKGD